ncbi:MAG TPA: DUF1801 domain-containing protein [Longimicrobium sp.]|nr:DUF1801 domain-containing protein [Longimicrobium sp.]
MKAEQNKVTSIDEYIAGAPEPVRPLLAEMRAIIHAAAPEATEKISYGMPTFFLDGNLVYFAAFKHHIGFYPAPAAIEAFEEELKRYKTSKGAIQLPFDEPLPRDLITRIVELRVAENRGKKEERKS